MATLSSIVKGSKELKDVAGAVKNVALFFAPKKTGNLKRKLNSANRPNNMIKLRSGNTKQTISISLNVAPSGAEYGKWWNSPNVSRTVRGGKTKNVPRSIDFGKQAMNDPSVKKQFAEFFSEFADEFTKFLVKELKS